MIRKKWRDRRGGAIYRNRGWNLTRRLSTGEAVELTRELADQLGMMEDDTMSAMHATIGRPRLLESPPFHRVRLPSFSAPPGGLFQAFPQG